jgi:hypothetical protein
LRIDEQYVAFWFAKAVPGITFFFWDPKASAGTLCDQVKLPQSGQQLPKQ